MEKKTFLNQKNKQIIVAIGSSAGGLDALMTFLTHLPAQLNCTIIIAQHLADSPKSQLVKILSRKTNYTVVEAGQGSTLELNTIYVAPAHKDIQIIDNLIVLTEPAETALSKPSINILFNSLAKSDNINHVFAIVMSGTGHDGSEGIRNIKAAGGYVIVHEPSTAEFDAMPLSAIDTGCANEILPVNEMGEEILKLVLNGDSRKNVDRTNDKMEEDNRIRIFELLSEKMGTNFSNYKSTTINRRVNKRIQALHLYSITEYLQYIEVYPSELELLYGAMLIGVTSFFRDTAAFESLKIELKKIIDTKVLDKEIRIWSVGCATGKEAYTIAILLLELLGDKINNYTIKIFATDIDDNALAIARKGAYKKQLAETIPPDLLQKYFTPKNKDSYEVKKLLRSIVFFSIHDITNKPPFIKMDMIVCRNLLIYFDTSLQKRILPLFHYSLKEEGILFLGKSESIGTFSDLFTAVDIPNKIYEKKKLTKSNPLIPFFINNRGIPDYTLGNSVEKKMSVKDQIKETLLNTLEYPYVVIDENGDIQESNGDLRLFISLSPGAMNTNLLKMVNKEMQQEVRSLFSIVRKENKPGKSKLKRFELYDKEHFVTVSIKPLVKEKNTANLYLVLFETLELAGEITHYHIPDDKTTKEYKFVELEQELTTTKEHLNTYIEELEALNEKMQCSNEELQSTNEELQSTNEELHSTGEELQSSNEELNLTNDALNHAGELSKSANETLDIVNKALHKADILLKMKDKEVKRAILQGEEKKRKEISMELHDNICQMLVGAKMLLSSYEKSKNDVTLQDGITVINDSIKEIRNLSHDIYLPKEIDEGLIVSLRTLLNQMKAVSSIDFKLKVDISDKNISTDFKINLYRIVQEQIQNIIKHSQASNAIIELKNISNKLIVNIKDDGIGFISNSISDGIGLSNIKTRVELFDGNLTIRSAEGEGVELKMEFEMIHLKPEVNK